MKNIIVLLVVVALSPISLRAQNAEQPRRGRLVAPDSFDLSKDLETYSKTQEQGAGSGNYACAVRRWHYSGQAGYEVLAVIDTVDSVMSSTGYLYGRTDHDLDEYAVQISVYKGRLQYSFSRDPKHDSAKRQYLVKAWTEVPFANPQKPSKTTVQLLGSEAFREKGSAHLEMICYQVR